MNTTFKESKFDESSFTCPHCGVLAQMVFFIPSAMQQTIWLTQRQIAELFKNIFKEGELVKNSVCVKFTHTANDGKYNLYKQKTKEEIEIAYEEFNAKTKALRKGKVNE